ncbi:MAG: bifunctional folylpolyglutamate synthase/dihydrofolate synthase [Clostridia bacterium]|nr:bifunctional folylpolyglutamate synthase/dihydrofolate synthase [Clostridia bacterium]
MTQSSDFSRFANSFQAIARLRLESIECLLNHLGNPQNDLKFVHIAGTNGKGSVCSFLQCIFTDAGLKTGKYTSPNLISVCERISVDGVLITDTQLESALKIVEKAVESVIQELGDSPTQFEIWTAAAFLFFKEQKCDIVVLETGLGGAQDATNIIPPPLASVITRIDLDHTEYLGDTIEKIAAEKAGIIKAPTDGTAGLCITAWQSSEVLSVLSSVCREKNNTFIISNTPKNCVSDGFSEVFDYTTSDKKTDINKIRCGISGFYQPENAGLAAECAYQLRIPVEYIRSGIKRAKNPARFEVVSQNPLVIYDGAHNKNGMSALVSCLERYFADWQGATFITAFMGDKDIRSAFEVLQTSGFLKKSKVFAVSVKDNPRAATPEKVCEIAAAANISAIPYKTLAQAYLDALKEKKPIILCGSLYLYKDFDEVLKNI